MANSFVHRFAGKYWKNASLNARCVPDGDMEGLLAEHRVTADGREVMLFVMGIKSGTSATQVRDIFKDFTLHDVNVPPGGKTFYFIFLLQEDANALLAQFGRGVHHGGKFIKVNVSNKGKKKCGRASVGGTSSAPAISSAVSSGDLRFNSPPYGVSETTLRGVFKDFGVSKVVVKKNGYAFFGVASSEAEKAVHTVYGRKIGDRGISVKIAECRR